MNLQFFNLSEFDAKDANGVKIPGTGGNMRASTLVKCDKLRDLYGKPLVVASAMRTPERNKQVGGASKSSHLQGYAVDWKNIPTSELIRFLEAAWGAGFYRFGIMETSVHTDDDPTKASLAMWDYPNTKGTPRMKAAREWFDRKINEG